MQIQRMDSDLIAINNIRNIESIKVWDLVKLLGNKNVVVPSIMVYYDGGKQLQFCALDKYFKEFTLKIVEVYNDEKDNIVEDGIVDPFHMSNKIQIDDSSKKILLSGKLAELDKFYQFYDGKVGYDNSLFFQSDEVKLLVPIIEFHLKKIMKSLKCTISFDGDISGYRDNYFVSGKLDGVDINIFGQFVKQENSNYVFNIGGFLPNFQAIEMNICFEDEKIKVVSRLNDLVFEDSYVITKGMVKEIHEVRKNDALICYENKDLTRQVPSLENLALFDEKENLDWFLLPWNAYYGVKNSVEDLSNDEKISVVHNIYLSYLADSFMKKEFYSRKYKRRKNMDVLISQMTLSGMNKTCLGILLDRDKDIYVIETKFNEASSSEYYKGRLENKCFYNGVVSQNGLKGIGDNLIELNSEDTFGASDLRKTDNILKLVKGDSNGNF